MAKSKVFYSQSNQVCDFCVALLKKGKSMKRQLTAFTLLLGLIPTAYAVDQAEHEVHHPKDAPAKKSSMMHECSMMGEEGKMMHAANQSMSIANIDDGVIIKWTSDDPQSIEMIKKMAQKMKAMHGGSAH